MDGPTEAQIKELWEVHEGEHATAARQFRADIFDPRRRWAKKDGYYRLSDRLWQGGQDVRRQINEVLQEAIRNGTDALDVADELEQYLNPAYAPRYDKNGKLRPAQKKSIVTEAPGRGGMGSFPARRLARTEITRVHGAATIWTAERTPFAKGVKWNLSGRHPKADECDRNAERNVGLGPGVYPAKDVPRYPSHPQDLCHLSVVTEDDVDAIVEALKAEYGLDEAVREVVSNALPFEDPFLRATLPSELRSMMGVATDHVVVPMNIRDKIVESHALDIDTLQHLNEFFEGWELAGISPKGVNRLEVYGRIDDIWTTAVVAHDERIDAHVLVTLHRIERRKVLSRERKGYLTRREEA